MQGESFRDVSRISRGFVQRYFRSNPNPTPSASSKDLSPRMIVGQSHGSGHRQPIHAMCTHRYTMTYRETESAAVLACLSIDKIMNVDKHIANRCIQRQEHRAVTSIRFYRKGESLDKSLRAGRGAEMSPIGYASLERVRNGTR